MCLQTAVSASGGDDMRLQAKLYRCLGSWFTVCAIPQDNIVNCQLLSNLFQSLVGKEGVSF